MEKTWAAVTDYSKEVDKTERQVDGSIIQQTVIVKFRRPDRVYLRVIDGPKKGSEIIYPKNDGEAVAIAHAGGLTGGFSRLLKRTVLLKSVVPTEFSVNDPRIIRGQHQTIVDSSLGATINRIADNIRTAIDAGEGTFQLVHDCEDGNQCLFRIDVELPAEAGKYHTARPDESLWTIAKLYGRTMYVIWYNNPQMKDPSDVRPGQIVFVPKYYGPKGRIWVSPDSKLLSKIEIFDAEGKLFERYVYRNININPGLSDLNFDPQNPDYNF